MDPSISTFRKQLTVKKDKLIAKIADASSDLYMTNDKDQTLMIIVKTRTRIEKVVIIRNLIADLNKLKQSV
jgi:hypothetical protein